MQRVAFLVCAALVAACSSSGSTGPSTHNSGSATPPTGFVVTIAGPTMVLGHDTTVSTANALVCYLNVIASASGGTASDVATWGAAHEIRVLEGTSDTVNKVFPKGDTFFGDDPQLAHGAEVEGKGYEYWTGPFTVTFAFYYSTPETSLDSAMYKYTCQ